MDSPKPNEWSQDDVFDEHERELQHFQGIVEACERVSAIASRAPAALEALERIAEAQERIAEALEALARAHGTRIE
jgi:hypothetical protein